MNVLVLGGSGFIGSHVVQSLIAGGDSVVVYGRNTNIGHIPMVNVKYIDGSLSDTVQLSIALNDIDVVVHLISSTIPATSNADPQYDINQNLIHSVGLLQLMKEKAVGRIVYLSSGGAIYGNNVESPISELHNNFPVCSYGIVKLAFENISICTNSCTELNMCRYVPQILMDPDRVTLECKVLSELCYTKP